MINYFTKLSNDDDDDVNADDYTIFFATPIFFLYDPMPMDSNTIHIIVRKH